jgi:sugar phosphate isomerase/epimerase
VGAWEYRGDDVGVCPGTLLADPTSYDATAFAETARIAAEEGFPSVGLWTYAVQQYGPDAARRLLDDVGLTVRAVEGALHWGSGPEGAQADADQHLDVASTLGADILLVAHLGPIDSFSRTVDGFATLCERARDHDVDVCIEWVPWFGIPDLATAWRVVQASGAPNGGLCLDWLHWQLQPGGPDYEQLAAIPAARIHYVQVCDAPATAPTSPEGYMEMAMSARPLPGQGVVDIPPLLTALAAMGATPFFAYEQFNAQVASAGVATMARLLRENARRVFDGSAGD